MVRAEGAFEHEGNRAVREGPWKLVSRHGKAWELYDLSSDRSETSDQAAGQPERVAKMTASYEAWAERCGVLPWPVKRREGYTPPEYTYPLTAPQLEEADGARKR